MSVEAIYKGRRARVIGEFSTPREGWAGVKLAVVHPPEVLLVRFDDPDLDVEPSDLETEAERVAFDKAWKEALA